jgi:ribosomal protein L11
MIWEKARGAIAAVAAITDWRRNLRRVVKAINPSTRSNWQATKASGHVTIEAVVTAVYVMPSTSRSLKKALRRMIASEARPSSRIPIRI